MRPWRTLIQSAGLAVVVSGLAAPPTACGRASGPATGRPPDFVGWVTAIEPADGGAEGRLVVESQTDKIVRRLVVTVTRDCAIYRREAGVTRSVGFPDVAVHDQARLWLKGPLPRSFPAQAVARSVVVERVY